MKRHPTGMPIILMLLFILTGISKAWADIIVMNNGMLVNGKIIKETVPRYLFTNSYGTFNIKKELVKEIYITGSYTEDIAIMQKMGAKIDEAIIKKNIEEGLKRKKIEDAKKEKKRLQREKIEAAKKKREEAEAEKKRKRLKALEAAEKKRKEAEEAKTGTKETEKIAIAKTIKRLVKGHIEVKKEKVAKEQKRELEKPTYWNYGRLGIEGAYYSTLLTTSLFSRVPHCLSLQLTYDQGLDALIKKRHPAMPGIRIEAGYIDFEKTFLFKSSQRISGYTAQAGPMWALPSLTNIWGCFVLAALPGAGYFDIINKEASTRSKNFHFSAVGFFGYEYSFKVISLFIHLRYMYIYDQNIQFHSVGGSIGFSCRLW